MIKVYDQDMGMLAVLEYADAVGYELAHNELWTATFRLPKDDPKNAYCQMHNLVSLDDGPRDLGMYRIIGMPESSMTAQGSYIEYSCEHVVATLLDDVLFGYHEMGGAGVDTAAVIRYILAQQGTVRWQLGACEFTDQYAYKFENDTLLGALMSLGNVLTEPYSWEYDTSTIPWTIHLRRADTAPGCGIYYKRNLQEITKAVDASTLVTRLYLLGYGEGVNQLTIRDINGGVPYIDADTIDTYGVKKSVFVDRRIEDAAALKARGAAMLEGLKIPYISYTAKAADLVQLSGDAWDEFMPGKIVHVMDGEDGIEFEARIASISKEDVQGRRGDVGIVIANSPRDIADSINALADRQGINDLYSQGATNLYAQQFADNADADHPAVMRVYIPKGCVRINQMLISCRVERFRAYEKGAAAGGGTETTSSAGGGTETTSGAGGGSERTSGAGGGTETTSDADGDQVVVAKQYATSVAAYCGPPLSGGSSSVNVSICAAQTTGSSSLLTTDSGGGELVTGEGGEHTHSGPSHTHTGPSHNHYYSSSKSLANNHNHSVTVNEFGTVTTGYANQNSVHDFTVSGNTYSSGDGETGFAGTGDTGSAGAHRHYMASHTHGMTHTHTVPAHSHSFNHYHDVSVGVTIPEQSIEIPSHTHTVKISAHSHSITIPEHTHGVTIPEHTHNVTIQDHSHSITVPEHTHGIEYGIYEGGRAGGITIRVDGVAMGGFVGSHADDMDIADYLEKDEEGKITRGCWHTVELVPDTLTRIEANLFVQAFVQSVGGGNY